MFKKTLILFSAATMVLHSAVQAQTKTEEDHSYKPLLLKLDDKGKKFIRFITWHQLWVTSTDNNPGTVDINGKPVNNSLDVGIRRSRLLIHAQISPRFLILTHFGINNQSFSNGGASGSLGNGASGSGQGGKRPQLYIHDAWTEYAIVPKKLHMGVGLHYWNGVSRMSSISTLNFMTLDAPIVNWYNIETTDQFARQIGIYAKGQLGKIDYRFHLNKPFAFGTVNTNVSSPIATNVFTEKWSTGGYVNYMFFDKESNVLPFMVGTYLGQKKVFNIGAGWYSHAGVTASRATPTDSIQLHNQSNFGIDAYLDLPINKKKGTAFNAYSVFYINDYGPNYLRNIGILNQHTGVQSASVNAETSWAGGGNNQPTLGTGNIWYTQVGYLLPKLKNGTAFMPYATFTYKDFERLDKPSGQFDLGVNYFINNHNAKISLQYSSHPVYKAVAGSSTPERNGSAEQLILQTHIFL